MVTIKSGATRVKAIVLVNPTPSDIPLIKTILAEGMRPITIVSSSTAPIVATLQKNEARCLDILYGTTVDEIIFQLGALHYDIRAIIPGSGQNTLVSDTLATQMGLPGNPIASAETRTDQIEINWTLAAKGLRVSQFAICPSVIHAIRFARKFEYPILIKPRTGNDSRLQFRCTSDDEVQNAVTQIKNTSYKSENTSSSVVAEECLGGTEYLVNLFSTGTETQVTGTWEIRTTQTPQTQPMIHDLILRRTGNAHLEILNEYAISATRAIGLRIGASYAKIVMTSTGPVLLEIANGFSSHKTALMTQLFSDFDPYQQTIEIFTRGKASKIGNVAYTQEVWITSHSSTGQGTVSRIEGIEKIKTLPGYLAHVLTATPGTLISPTLDSTHVPLICWFADTSADQIRLSALLAHKEFRIQTDGATQTETYAETQKVVPPPMTATARW